MYAWFYRRLPGPTPVRILLLVLLAAAVFWLLMEVVFPAVEPYMPYSDVSVGAAPATPPGAGPPVPRPAAP